jgi:hypothetical protein
VSLDSLRDISGQLAGDASPEDNFLDRIPRFDGLRQHLSHLRDRPYEWLGFEFVWLVWAHGFPLFPADLSCFFAGRLNFRGVFAPDCRNASRQFLKWTRRRVRAVQ